MEEPAISPVFESLLILWHFVRTRWFTQMQTRAVLEARQQKRMHRFLQDAIRNSPHYQTRHPRLGDFPLMSKEDFLAHFPSLNRQHITLEEATVIALRAERERDFVPKLPDGVCVGLSSGTSGNRNVFLVGREDRCRWAGQMFARMLSSESLRHLLNPLREPLRIAFFLRASSNLYTTLSSRRVQLAYYDLTQPFGTLTTTLEQQNPHILVAPATVLAELAAHPPARLRPTQIISVAEVLDTRDRESIEQTFHVRVSEIYQASEGFLGATCEHGTMHLNEDALHIEQHWLDDAHTRFHPIITDFSRHTQWFVRYQLNDVLCPTDMPCPCGRVTRSLQRIEGRAEEILWAREPKGQLQTVFPESLRQALYSIPQPLGNYRIEQHADCWNIQLQHDDPTLEQTVRDAITLLLKRLQLTTPELRFLSWTSQPPAEKMKRIRCITRPT